MEKFRRFLFKISAEMDYFASKSPTAGGSTPRLPFRFND